MTVIIISNYSPKFRNFIIDDVLNNTMDFSKYNKMVSKITSIFHNEKIMTVSNQIDNNYEKYKDGIKYFIGDNEKIYLKESGIVTFIGEKEGYNYA